MHPVRPLVGGLTVVDPLREPVRIAFAGDWHMNTTWATYAIRRARQLGAEVVVHCGDFGWTFPADYLAAIDEALGDMPLLFVDGNHENFDVLYRVPVGEDGLRRLSRNVFHLPRGFRWEWGGVRFMALGGAYSVDRPWRKSGESWWVEEMVTPEQVMAAAAGGPVDVLVSHDCPAGVVIPGIDDRQGPAPWPEVELLRAHEHRLVLREVVDAVRPRLLVHGHYHVAYDSRAQLGFGPMAVIGLDCDGTTIEGNLRDLTLGELPRGGRAVVSPG